MSLGAPTRSSFFISHAHSDEALARAFDELLQATLNVDTFNSSEPENLTGEANWYHDIRKQLCTCSGVLLLLTASARERSWVNWETIVASHDYFKNIIPVSFHFFRSGGPFTAQYFPKTKVFDGTTLVSLRRLIKHIAEASGTTVIGAPDAAIHRFLTFASDEWQPRQSTGDWHETYGLRLLQPRRGPDRYPQSRLFQRAKREILVTGISLEGTMKYNFDLFKSLLKNSDFQLFDLTDKF